MTITDILALFTEGSWKAAAAGALFVVFFVLERFPLVGEWLSKDTLPPRGWPDWIVWFTGARKKAIANVVLAWTPAAYLLASGAPWEQVVTTALVASFGAAGLNGMGKTLSGGTGLKKTLAGLVMLVSLTGCSGAGAQSPEVIVADVVTAAVNEAIPRVAKLAESEYVAAAEAATSREDGEQRLRAVEAKWSTVEASLDALRVVHEPVAAALESGKTPKPSELRKLVGAYCSLRAAFVDIGEDLPDVPILGCGGES